MGLELVNIIEVPEPLYIYHPGHHCRLPCVDDAGLRILMSQNMMNRLQLRYPKNDITMVDR